MKIILNYKLDNFNHKAAFDLQTLAFIASKYYEYKDILKRIEADGLQELELTYNG